MTTYRAQVRVDDGMLHSARPLLAPDAVAALIDGAVYALAAHSDEVLSIDLVVETAGDSESPIGDSIAATSSAPLDVESSTLDELNAAQVTR